MTKVVKLTTINTSWTTQNIWPAVS